MSHFSVYVFSKQGYKNVEQLLAPYDENLPCAPYIEYTKEQAIRHVREQIEEYKDTIYAEYIADPDKYEKAHDSNPLHIRYLKEEFPKELDWTDEECYQELSSRYEDDMIDDNGNLYSDYNPNSKWDWYEVGGRWGGDIITKQGKRTNKDVVSAIDWDKTAIPFAFITPNGIWHESGEMGWWGMVTNEKDKNTWKSIWDNMLKSLDKNTMVTLVDCHI